MFIFFFKQFTPVMIKPALGNSFLRGAACRSSTSQRKEMTAFFLGAVA